MIAHRAGYARVRLVWCLCAGALIAWLSWGLTTTGPIITPDSMEYIGSARALADHGALRVPFAGVGEADSTSVLRQFTPGYPIALAALLSAGIPDDVVVRVMNAFAAFLLAAIVTAVCVSTTEGKWIAGIGALLLGIAVRGIPLAYVSAWSEPIFLVCVVSTVALMAAGWFGRGLSAQRSQAIGGQLYIRASAIVYGTTAAVGNAVRYAGVSLVVAAVVWAACDAWFAIDQRDGSVRARLLRVCRAASMAALPGALFNAWWLLRARHFAVETPVATLGWMGNLAESRDEGLRTLTEQLVPFVMRGRGIVACTFALLVAWVLGRAIRHAWVRVTMTHTDAAAERSPTGAVTVPSAMSLIAARTILACLLVAASYVGMLSYSRLFVGATIPLDDRLLSPVMLVLGMATLIAIDSVSRGTPVNGLRAFGVAAALAWLVIASVQSLRSVSENFIGRTDYGSVYWTDTPITTWLRREGRSYALFSNDAVAVYFTTGRPSRVLPERGTRVDVAAVAGAIQSAHGVLIDYADPPDPTIDAKVIAQQLGMCAVAKSDIGVVWAFPHDAGTHCN